MQSGPYTEHEIQAAGDIDASGSSAAVDVSAQKDITVYVNCTAVAGTDPTLDIKIQDSVDGQEWFDVASLTQLTAAGKLRQRIEGIGNFVRANYTIGGTDTPTFTLDIQAIGRN